MFHQENGGLSSALNVGLRNFSGDWLGFVDSDDWVEPEMYEALRSAIGDADVAVCSYFVDTVSGFEEIKNKKKIRERVISTENMFLYPLMRDDYMGFCGYVWNKLYSAGVIKDSGLFFDEKIKYAMDVLFYESLVLKYKCIGTYVDKPLYHYYQRDDAITKSESYDIKTDILVVYKLVEEMLPCQYKFRARGFYCYHAGAILELARKKRDKEMFAKMQDEIRAHYRDYKRTNRKFPKKFKEMQKLTEAKLVNRCGYDIDRFAEQIGDRSIVSFGAYMQFGDWIMQNYDISNKIVSVIDNSASIQGSTCEIADRKVTVVSLKKFLKLNITDFIILLNTNRHVDSMIRQLDLSGEFENVDVFVAELRKYKSNETIRKIQTVQLGILDEFVRICKKHNLSYYLVGGTLLGAARHKGFIPWDDDIDVGMPQDDFNEFVKLPSSEFGKEFVLHWITTDKTCVHVPARLKDGKTYRLEWSKGYETANEKYNAIGICIFRELSSKRELGARISLYDKFWLNGREILQRVAYHKLGLCIVSPGTIFSIFPLTAILKMREMLISIFAKSGSGYKWMKPWNELFGEGVSIEFEGKTYNAPSDWDYYLCIMFGADYMQLPPPEKRFSHCPKKLSFDVKTGIWEDV